MSAPSRMMRAAARAALTLPAALWLVGLQALGGEGSSQNYVLESSTMGMLGGTLSSENYSMTATLGQPIAAGSLSGGLFTGDLGFLNDLDADGDGVSGASDLCPTQFAGCNDGNGDGCIDVPDTDADGDGVGRGACDCDDGNPQIWGRPGEVRNVRLTSSTALAWDAPAGPGGTAPRYDVIRSAVANDFVAAGSCIESDDAGDRTATDAATPAARGVFYYLVRAENGCASGVGPLGTSRGFLARTARDCP